MKCCVFSAALLLLCSLASAQSQIPPGTILPAQLSSSIDSRKAHPGERISARLMQDVQLTPHDKLKAGAKVVGHIVSANARHVTLSFDDISAHRRLIPLRADLRSIASMMAVEDAQLPTNNAGGDRGSSIADWNTVQIGGQAVYGRGGSVYSGKDVVGHSLLNGGMLAVPAANSQCRGDLGNPTPQSFWIFSSDACGAYGFDDLSIAHAGRSNPAGQIGLSARTRVLIRAGSGLLLRVTAP